MLVFEFKAYGNQQQFNAVDEALRTVQFIRNKAIRLWMDNVKIGKNDLSKYCAVLAKEFPFCDKLNSQARQATPFPLKEYRKCYSYQTREEKINESKSKIAISKPR